jgi:serine phosphatase RsbU (regulator of sigma subunit)
MGRGRVKGVAIMMGNCPEYLDVFVASQKIGMYTIPINTSLRGDGLFLYTDCLADTENSDGKNFGEEGILKSLKDAPDGSAQVMLDFIMGQFYGFIKQGNLKDDVSAIMIKKK